MLKNFYFLDNVLLLNSFIISIFFLILLSTIFVVLIKDTIHAIFYFMFICLYMTELCILLQMEFLALNFIIIYLGAICVLILFQAKLVRLLTEKNPNVFISNELFVPCLIIFIILPIIEFFSIYFLLINNSNEFIITSNIDINQLYLYNNWLNDLNNLDTLKIIGIYIYKYNAMYIILGSLILILAMLGAIILTLEKKKNIK